MDLDSPVAMLGRKKKKVWRKLDENEKNNAEEARDEQEKGSSKTVGPGNLVVHQMASS